MQAKTAIQSALRKRVENQGQKTEKRWIARETSPETMRISFYKNVDELCK
jgi:hypothetical protein